MIKINRLRDNYIISSNGLVYSIPRRGTYGGVLKYTICKFGYKRIGIRTDNKSKGEYLHRLLAETFIENPNEYPQVNHKDCNKLNNDLDNLEWCTPQQNAQHARDNDLPKVQSNTNQKNIYYDKKEKKYSVIFRRNNINNRLGRFKTLEGAIIVRDEHLKNCA